MNKLFLTFIILFVYETSFSQTNKCDTTSTFAQNSQFFFNSFHKGTVVFNDNTKLDAVLNYNVISNDIYYIENNKYYSLNPDEVKMIVICDYRFYFEGGKVLELIYNKEIMLVIERNANTEEFFDQKGAYGATSPNTVGTKILDISISNMPEDRSYLVNLRDKGDKVINITMLYKIKYGKKIMPATKNSFLKIYNDNKEKLKQFFNDNDFDFHKKDDLIKIANYCNDL